MEKIGFFGGCFNPINNLHIEIANKLITSNKLNKVIFVPVNDFYKKKDLANSKHRYAMLKLALQDFENLEVDDIELKENRKLYAIDAFKIIEKSRFITECNKNNVFFIMGSDNYNKMPKWKNYEDLKNKYNYIIIDRNKSDITSTIIRELLNSNTELAKQYLPKKVYEYIVKNNLYKL